MRSTLYYDARLKGLRTTPNGQRLLIDYQGRELLLAADAGHLQQCEKYLALPENRHGLIGLARLVRRKNAGHSRSKPLYRFDAYCDQSLRRAFDLDDYEPIGHGHNLNCIGWRNDTHPDGFLAPRGIIPGKAGRFVSDNTEAYTVCIPIEFAELAARMKTDPVSLLQGFMADVCQLQHSPELPRADQLASRGTEAVRKARDYLRLAWRLKKDFF